MTRYLKSSLISSLCLVFLLLLGLPTQAKEAMVLLPLDVKNITNPDVDIEVLGSALQEGLLKRYQVYYGNDVEKALQKEFQKLECTPEQCIQGVATTFGTELIADVRISGGKAGYLISYKLNNIVTNEVVESKTVPCQRCSIFKLIDVMRKIGSNTLKAKDLQSTDTPISTMTIAITSTPSAANISIKEIDYGKTPITFQYKEGIHILKVEKFGYLSIEKEIQLYIEDGKTNANFHIPLVTNFGTLSIEVDQSAEINLIKSKADSKGKRLSTHRVPQKSIVLEPGNYTYTLNKKGYHSITGKFTIKNQKNTSIKKKMVRQFCQVQLNYRKARPIPIKLLKISVTDHNGNKVSLPKKIVFNKINNIPTGNYQIKVESTLYQWTKNVTCQDKVQREDEVKLTLKPFPQRHYFDLEAGVIIGDSEGLEASLLIQPKSERRHQNIQFFPLMFDFFLGSQDTVFSLSSDQVSNNQITAEGSSHLGFTYYPISFRHFAVGTGIQSTALSSEVTYEDTNNEQITLPVSQGSIMGPFLSLRAGLRYNLLVMSATYRLHFTEGTIPLKFDGTDQTVNAKNNQSAIILKLGLTF